MAQYTYLPVHREEPDHPEQALAAGRKDREVEIAGAGSDLLQCLGQLVQASLHLLRRPEAVASRLYSIGDQTAKLLVLDVARQQ
jgi:hypothetical protein